MNRTLFALTICVTLTACATQSFTLHDAARTTPDVEKMQAFFISGIGQEQALNAAEVCGGADKVARVEARLNFLDGFLGVITYGIFTPRTAKVYCRVPALEAGHEAAPPLRAAAD